MRWSRLKKTINVDDIASSVLDGKKRRTATAGKARSSPPSSSSSVKVEKAEDGAAQLPPPSASAVGITLKEEEGGEEGELASQEELAPVLFAGLPKPPKYRRGTGAEEQVSISVIDEAAGAIGRFAATQVPHLPRVAEAAAVEAPESGSQSPVPQKPPPVSVVQDPPAPKSEPKPQPGEDEEEGEGKEEEGKAMKSESPPTDTICENTGSAVVVVLTAANGSKKRKVEST